MATKDKTAEADRQDMADKTQYLAIGRLRRDLGIVGVGDEDEVKEIARAAVREGRAAEVFVTEITGYFSESKEEWIDPDDVSGKRTEGQATTILNPSAAEDSDAPAGKGAELTEGSTARSGPVGTASALGPKGGKESKVE